MKILNEFKAFAMKGNVVDMAVGVILGGAFGGVVSSMVSDVLMPPLGYLIGGVDFRSFELVLKPATAQTAAVCVKYGQFLNAVISFLIVAVATFLLIRLMNTLRLKQETAPEAPKGPTVDQALLMEIRDLLRKNNVR